MIVVDAVGNALAFSIVSSGAASPAEPPEPLRPSLRTPDLETPEMTALTPTPTTGIER
jgi:hypothetical protein